MKHANINIIGIPEGEEKGYKNVLEQIMVAI